MPSGSFWQCGCGELELNPLVYPGAHTGTVDEEALDEARTHLDWEGESGEAGVTDFVERYPG